MPNGVQDFATNENPVGSNAAAVHIDHDCSDGVCDWFPGDREKRSYDLTVTFSEPVNDFAVPDDLTLGLVTEPGVTSATPIATAALTASDPGRCGVYSDDHTECDF